jgi:hypothetical protein
MAFAALGAGLLGAGISAYGQIEQGQATANAANYAAQVARNNELVATQNANYALAAGQQKAQTESLKGAATGGRIKAAQAASGIDINTGSALRVQQGQREQAQLDTETVLNNAELQAYGYRTQAANYKAQSELDTAEAEQAPIGAGIGAAGGFLGSASGVALKWSQLGSP